MNKYCILFCIFFITNLTYMQAQNDYAAEWKKVATFDQKGLPKSALEVVETIFTRAKNEKNSNQVTKSLLYKSKYILTLEEDAQLKIIKEFKTEIENSEFPQQNILESILANLYWQYFQQNRWKFYNRTNTATKVDAEDFRTWDLETLFGEVHTYFQRSLENGLLAQQTELSRFDPILITRSNSKEYRPSLFDFLSHNALEFYKTSETNITRPSYAFEIGNPEFLGVHTAFTRLKITTKDTLSLQFHALKIYQNLLNFHTKDTNPKALIEVNIERLHFVKENATFFDKNEVYLSTLLKEKEVHATDPSTSMYDYEIALFYRTQAQTYKPGENEVHQWKLKKAIEVCDASIKKFPGARGAKNCAYLKQQILEPHLNSITTESYIPIEKASRLLINYKNLDKLYFKALQISPKQLSDLKKRYQKKEQLNLINSLAVVTSWDASLKNEKDYQNHSTEIIVPPLAQGMYLIVGSTEEKMVPEATFAFANMQVTNLTLVQDKIENGTKFQVLDRFKGTPMRNASIALTSDNRRSPLNQKLTTDKNGEAIFSSPGNHYSVKAMVSLENDKAIFSGIYLNRGYRRNNKEIPIRYTTFLFTDRSIYRPGQVVYFKGIMMSSQGKEDPKIVADYPTYAKLLDVNGQVVSELKFTTNTYGSFAGEFVLPSSGLTGNYSIQTENYQSTSFSVEEYKRPKFETKFEPVTNTYKVGDAIPVKGTAMAYAGSTISDAKVTYRVTRKVQYPIWCYWFPRFNTSPQEITHGDTTTDAKGEFSVLFEAIPDKTADQKNQPVFTYEITADVTDINGETRSATAIVSVGYHAMTATLSIPDPLDKNAANPNFTVATQNLNNEPIANEGTIQIFKLIPPTNPIRKRPWKAPDYVEISQEEFKKQFPNDAYTNEDDYRSWKKGKEVFKTTYNTEKTANTELGVQQIDIKNLKNWKSGKYVIELNTKDRFGQEVKELRYVTLLDPSDPKVSDQQLFEITTDKTTYAIGDEVRIQLNSAAENLAVTLDIEKNGKIIKTEYISLSDAGKTLTIPVTKEDLGGFAVSYSLVKYNGYKSGVLPIMVPYAPTDLSIETTTFRDKLKPGQEETWSFMIKGPKGDKVTAEVLASMYDASLDQFKPHQWYFSPINRPTYYSRFRRNAQISFGTNNFDIENQNRIGLNYQGQSYDQLNWFGLYFGNSYRGLANASMRKKSGMPMAESVAMMAPMEDSLEMEEGAVAGSADSAIDADESNGYKRAEDQIEEKKESLDAVPVRKNLQETAFFFPQLNTDPEGNVRFSFTAPEALTQWKLQLLAHTKEMHSAVQTLETVTQKELMILPNPPRFLREGDQIVLSTKLSNLSTKSLSGNVVLQLVDAITNASIDSQLNNTNAIQNFTVASKGNTNISWTLTVPDDITTVQYKIVAKAGDFSDGEQNVLPVLSNRMLVTETLPMWIRSDQTKTFTLDKLKNNTSTTLKNHKLTLEMTSNPAWYAVQALPYLMEYPYECSEQTFSRYYANKLASHIANTTPRIKQVFDQWKSADALISNLEKNQELKSLMIQETPWLRDAMSETEQKKRIALLFDLNKMNMELQTALNKLRKMQHGSGAFPWFTGGRENRYITQHIAAGFGHLQKLGITEFDKNTKLMLQKAIRYLDQEFIKEYEELKRYCAKNKIDINKDHLSYSQLQYLYMRSFFKDIQRSRKTNEAWNYYLGQSKKYWISRSLYAQGLLALIMNRNQESEVATRIIRSLDEKSITSEELGMYWKSNTASWYWYQAPIETQALMVEVFAEIEKEPKRTEIIDNLKIWLLKNKQTNRWKTTKATSEAIYALLLQGSDWLSVTDMVDIVLGDQKVDPSSMDDIKVEAGTGYFKTSWNGKEIKSDMASAKITKTGKGIAWGALYWQYFEDLDKITPAETPLQLKKKLFLKKNTDRGEEITEITKDTKLELGDLVRVRIELRSDRAMEFVHMKDMRASGLEPINVISSYKYQDGLGYYESTKDASTNFFFDYLPKGVYVFEYDLRVNNKGDFSNGITTIQSMYAPEFSSHSEGVRVHVGE